MLIGTPRMDTKQILLATADIQTAVDVSQALGADWTTTCVTSEAEAFARLRAGSFNAFLADFNLGDPDASELLNQALEKCPHVTRFLFACEADLALVAAKVLGEPEILPKPIQIASLKSRIENGLKDSEPRQAAKPPPAEPRTAEQELSHVYAEVLQTLDSSTVTCRQIGAIIARDASLTKELLRLTRSTYLGLPRKITNPVEAVEVLGLETVKALVMARRFMAEHGHLNACYVSLDKIWQHSLNVAQIARDLVLFETKNRALASQALAAGLLHDLGKIVLATNFDDLYGRVHSLARKQPVALWEVEKEMFGASHGEIGACLLGMWNMSSDVVDAAAFHHEPPLGEHDQLTPLAAVHIANVLEHQLHPDDEFRVLPVVSTPFLNQLRLLQRLPIWRATFANQLSRTEIPDSDEATLVSATLEAGPADPAAIQEAGTVTATWTAEPATKVEASRATTSAPRPWWKGLFYTGIIAGLTLLLAIIFLERDSNDVAHVEARVSSQPETVVVATPPSSVDTAPVSTLEITSVTAESPAALETNVTTVAALAVSQPAPELSPAATAGQMVTNARPTILPVQEIVPPSAPAQPAFKLNGIFYSSVDPTAIVNGKSVRVGEKVNGATVIRIGRAAVMLEMDGQRKTIGLPTTH
jgi:putative nucleotidyltransferase with HDIG domain